jgi:tetratricopeptide (TPR) repeat protein
MIVDDCRLVAGSTLSLAQRIGTGPARPRSVAVRVAAILLLTTLLAATPTHVHAQSNRLIDSEPYDVIVLNEQNQGQVLKVLPLDLPGRKLPASPLPTDSIRVRLVSNPSEELEVSWSGIAKVELFEQLVLAEARQMISEGKFDEAFESLTFLHNQYPDTSGLDEAVDQLLYAEASSLYRQGELERALLLLDEIYQRTPTRRGLSAAMERVLDRTFEDAFQQRDFVQARRLYELANSKYAKSLPAMLQRWQQRMESVGTQALEALRADVAAGQLREAYMTGRRLMEIWPATPGAAELVRSVAARYPLLRVGVQQMPPGDSSVTSFEQWNWSARRAERLRTRHLFERAGIGPDGNEYECTVGEVELAETNRGLAIQTSPQAAQRITAVHLAQLLLTISDPDNSWFRVPWAGLVERVGAGDLNRVEASFRRPHLRPVALLDVSLEVLGDAEVRRRFQPYLSPGTATAVTRLTTAPTTSEGSTASSSAEAAAPGADSAMAAPAEQRYLMNPEYFAATATQPREVVEQRYETPQRAVQALGRGEIDLIDRAFPADVPLLQRDARWTVTPYRVPTVHVLIPNFHRPHAGNRLFRRGLVYAIDREKILRRDLLGGAELAGCKVVSGPFSPGISADDPAAYGYDARIEPRAYDPRHARTLLQLAQLELMAAAEAASTAPPTLESLVLVHPDHEIARVACAEIVEDLKLIGLPCTLRMLPSGSTRPDDDDWDLLYVDYTISEPLVDAARLLGFDGLVGSSSPHLNLALRQLSRVDNWNRTGERLRVIHQLCFDDTTIIPLWQIGEHLVCRKGIQGMVAQPMTTYQNIENWRLTPGSEP